MDDERAPNERTRSRVAGEERISDDQRRGHEGSMWDKATKG